MLKKSVVWGTLSPDSPSLLHLALSGTCDRVKPRFQVWQLVLAVNWGSAGAAAHGAAWLPHNVKVNVGRDREREREAAEGSSVIFF